MKKLLPLFLILFLVSGKGMGQHTFQDKKHAGTPHRQLPDLRLLNFPSVKKTPDSDTRNSSGTSGRKQAGSGPERLYQHTKIARAENGRAVFIESKMKSVSMRRTNQSVSSISYEYLDDIADLLDIKKPQEEFAITSTETDELGMTHVRLQQVYQGYPVFGSDVMLHLNSNREVNVFNGRSFPTPNLRIKEPSVTAEFAREVAMKDLQHITRIDPPGREQFEFLQYTPPAPELLIYQVNETESRLVWHLTVFPNLIERWEYYIDAARAEIVDKFNHSCSLLPQSMATAVDLRGVNRQIGTHQEGDHFYMINTSKPMFNAAASKLPDNGVGVILTLSLNNQPLEEGAAFYHHTSTNNSWDIPNAVSAHYNADMAYEYFRNTFNRNSIDGKGGSIYSIVDVKNADGTEMDNAFWNGAAMFYGNGNFAFSTPLAAGIDVGGHEMAHGVIQSTANLIYRDQSGAINESMADVFASMVDRDDWLLGEDIVDHTYFTSGAMRNLADPHNGQTDPDQPGWQPAHMTEFYQGEEDNGGVHINSGIPNKAFYLFATSVGKEVAEQVYYRALSTYLTASSQFIDLRLAVIQAATDLHGENSAQVNAVKTAFDAVGILDAVPDDKEDELPVAEGEDFLLLYSASPDDPNTLYLYDVAGDEFIPISQTKLYRKPSVSDDGSVALCVTEDHTLHYILLDGENSEEIVLNDEPIWGNVALSKDGTKLAAISNQQDNRIIVANLENDMLEEFTLYNPTTAEGVSTGNVLYADALEWDYSGEYIMYDALSTMENSAGEDIEYWDVGLIKVWDNNTNAFGDGNIRKIFSGLQEGTSIGNPSFSKTSRNVVAFDLFNEFTGDYEVIAANIETGAVKTVYSNTTLGFPNYSRTDDRIIFDATNAGAEPVVAAIGMNSDRITPAGGAEGLIEGAKWGIWFNNGERKLLSPNKDILDFRFNGTIPASIGSISSDQIVVKVPESTNVTSLVAHFTLSGRATAKVNGGQQLSGISSNNFSQPVEYTIIAEDGSTKTYLVKVERDRLTPVEDELLSNVLVYPNPFETQIELYIPDSGKKTRISILNTLGQELMYKELLPGQIVNGKTVIATDVLQAGAYVLRISDENRSVSTKIIKQR